MTICITWSDNRVQELKSLHARGYSASQIAVRLEGATRNSVCGKIHRLGLPPSPNKIRTAAPRAPREPKRKQEKQTIFRFIAANGNSNALRILKTIQTGMPNLRCVEVNPLHISFSDLSDGVCRFPYGDDPREMTFCGHPQFTFDRDGSDVTSSYCINHHFLCNVKPLPAKPRSFGVAA